MKNNNLTKDQEARLNYYKILSDRSKVALNIYLQSKVTIDQTVIDNQVQMVKFYERQLENFLKVLDDDSRFVQNI
jgi:hypothetical protein